MGCEYIFVLFSSKEHLQLFIDYMNKQHRCIKLTSETEQDNTFCFLDINKTYFQWCFYTLWKLHWSVLQEVIDFHFVISLLFYLLRLHTIPFGSWKTNRNFKKGNPSVRYYITINKNFLSRLYVQKQVHLPATKEDLLITTLSWNHTIKFKAKTATSFYCEIH